MQLIHAFSTSKLTILGFILEKVAKKRRKTILITTLSIYDHHLKKYQFFSLNKLGNRELYKNQK